MPIDVDRFEDADHREPTTSERIVQFLLAHDDRAYTRREIAAAIGANPETVGTNLTRLKDRQLVRHREPYWAIVEDHERVIEALGERYDDTVLDELPRTAGPASVPDETDRGGDALEAKTTGGTDDSSAPQSAAVTTPGPHRTAAAAFFERVRDRLDEDVTALYLFGSVARDTQSPTSDVDVLAVVDDDADYATIDDQLLDVAYDVQLEFDVPVEVHTLRASEFAERRDRGEPFVRTVVDEGEIVV